MSFALAIFANRWKVPKHSCDAFSRVETVDVDGDVRGSVTHGFAHGLAILIRLCEPDNFELDVLFHTARRHYA